MPPDLDAPAPDVVEAVAAPPCPDTALSSPLPAAADVPPLAPFPLPFPEAPPAADAPLAAPALACDEVAGNELDVFHKKLKHIVKYCNSSEILTFIS